MAEYVTKQEIEELLSQQTLVLLGAMSEHKTETNEHLKNLSDVINEHKTEVMQQMSEFDKKLDRLTTTLDNFLKRLTDHEDEFVRVW